MLVEVGKCKRCGGRMVKDDSPTVGFPDVEVVRCITCGDRVYKDHPRRDGGEYSICRICGKIFKRKKKLYKEENVCKECSDPENRVIRCIVCGVPIHRGIVCTKPRCKKSKKPLIQL